MPQTVIVQCRPIRMRPNEAAAYLAVSRDTMMRMIHRNIFTVADNGSRGVGRRIWLLVEELDLYAVGGVEAVKEHRLRKARGR